MVHQIKTFTAEPDDLNLIRGTHVVEREKQLPKVALSSPLTCCGSYSSACMCAHTQINEILKIKKKAGPEDK